MPAGTADDSARWQMAEFSDRLMQQYSITVKESRGQLSYLPSGRTKFIRAKHLGDKFDKAAVLATLQANAERKPKAQFKQDTIGKLIDIQSRMTEGKGIGYKRWLTKHNLKVMAQTVKLLQEKGLTDEDALNQRIAELETKYHDALAVVKDLEGRMKFNKELRYQVAAYASTKIITQQLKAAKRPAAFEEQHRAELTAYRAAAAYFKANNITKLPSPKKLEAEYAKLASEKAKFYEQYKEAKLPSYAICAKCNNDESYAPSRATIAKIVDFYNSQIRPPVEVYQFTHERLEDSDNIRYRSSSVFDPRFIGTYRGYYPSVTEDVVIGSYLIIFEEDARLKATLIMGLCSDREMKGTRLRALLSEERITYPKFREFHRNLPASRQRYSYYEGIVELTNSSLTICFHSSDMDQKKLILTLNLTGFHPSDPDREYLGGLAFALGTSDGPFDSRFFEMGLVRSTLPYFSLDSKGLFPLITPKVKNHTVLLPSKADTAWYVYFLKHSDLNFY